ncbi:hypothetical protein L7F22_046631 [Adiantum nelumboides]|nr:hypothetical protein [Adiantum nelumboides]
MSLQYQSITLPSTLDNRKRSTIATIPPWLPVLVAWVLPPISIRLRGFIVRKNFVRGLLYIEFLLGFSSAERSSYRHGHQRASMHVRGAYSARRWDPHHGMGDPAVRSSVHKIATLLKAANVPVESYWPALFAKLLEKRSVEDLITNVGSASGGGAATPPPVEEKKEEPKEESDEDMGFSLFD